MVNLEKILFLDIETVSQVEEYSELNEDMALLWNEKYENIKKRCPEKYTDEDSASSCLPDMGLFAEFGKIICISVGVVRRSSGKVRFKVTSYTDDDEKILLSRFSELVERLTKNGYQLCGHNIREFDLPYISRRMLINGIVPLPKILTMRMKPWDTPIIDTMDMWKFGDYKHYTSLKLLCRSLGVPSPKEDIEGKDVYNVYYQKRDMERISYYCQNDVIATLQVYLRLSGHALFDQEDIDRVSLNQEKKDGTAY